MNNTLRLTIDPEAHDNLPYDSPLLSELDVCRITASTANQVMGILNADVHQLNLAQSQFEKVEIMLPGMVKIPLPGQMSIDIAKFMKESSGDSSLNCNDFVFKASGRDRKNTEMSYGGAYSSNMIDRIPCGTPILFMPRVGFGKADHSARHSAISLGSARGKAYCIQKFGMTEGLWIARIEDVAIWYPKVAFRQFRDIILAPCKVHPMSFKKRNKR